MPTALISLDKMDDDDLEQLVIRLIYSEGLTQEEAVQKMGITRRKFYHLSDKGFKLATRRNSALETVKESS